MFSHAVEVLVVLLCAALYAALRYRGRALHAEDALQKQDDAQAVDDRRYALRRGPAFLERHGEELGLALLAHDDDESADRFARLRARFWSREWDEDARAEELGLGGLARDAGGAP